MPQQSKPQRETVGRVMHEFKQGELETSRGTPVRSRRQAVAIALHEAGTSRDESPTANRRNLARTKRREAAADDTKAALYAEATRRGIHGRSRMSKAELVRALRG
ncbi:hypothetical protein GCM10011504_51100 [Siccirubricoccus deserti]|uniref:Rho termination factor n=1 Tax=Siccirubricoccus deserti TaxID=2013562 RepID=A0A9X0R4A0_9PROT|nr:DUF6496 domain-containing protein [Siccirubricoccus deserti]MBC4018578.1 hypothetical protein [Siccirubricoccus deserti]GGC66902.1 hypothetical protein GCM10011504_51100 [Siccirubricoccus deserti]